MGKICTSYNEVDRAYNKVRMELWRLGVLGDGSKLDGVECLFDSFPVECVIRGAEGLERIVYPCKISD